MSEPRDDDSGAKLRARARLALRAERAFGLSSLPAPRANSADQIVPDECRTSDPETPAKPAPGARATQATAPAKDLFGRPVITPAKPPPGGLLPTLLAKPAFTSQTLSRDEKFIRLKTLDENEVKGCTKCRLCEQRTRTVFGEGDADAPIFFIGEGPGENEDLQGRPFVGRAGDLLNKWIAAMGLKREQVYIANIVKCRPPGNREPAPDETVTCTPYLERQLEIIRPRVIITLGRPSSQHMLQTKISMGKMRGQWHAWSGIKLMPTYHPAYVLRSYTYETRAAVWSDLQLVMKELGLEIPKRDATKQS